jgi:WD40 repeat protein
VDTVIRQAIAKIEVLAADASAKVLSRGTGFLVGDGLVLTALHVVANRRTDPPQPLAGSIRLTFPDLQTEASIDGELHDAHQDWALLICQNKPRARPIPMADWHSTGAGFETFGFPDANPRDGMVQSGRVKDHNAELDGAPVFQLFSEEAAAGNGAPAKGLSGAPVLIDGAVVGLLRFALMDQQRQTVAGTLYACPLLPIIERAAGRLPIPDPCHGLPGLPRLDLPATPFRYLERFIREDAEIFFGRGREIRRLYELLTSSNAAPLVLLYGQSGVGKSSFLDAGVLPRLAWYHDARYVRRDAQRSLLELLLDALGERGARPENTTLRDAWRTAERETGRPIILFLDQVEEVFTRPRAEGPGELEAFADALATLFGDNETRPQGRLVLAFRKEWLPEIQKPLEVRGIGHGKVFLEGLDRQAVNEVVTGLTATRRLRQHYGLDIETGLAESIADDLVSDPASPVAPTLQILLTKLWRTATAHSAHAPKFTRALYDVLREEGLMLGDFVDQQLASLREDYAAELDSGLAIDVLAYHTTALVTAGSRSWDELKGHYQHAVDRLPGLLLRMVDLYLLADAGGAGVERGHTTRLAHDTLAVHVRRRLDTSDLPGPRARRILDNRGQDWLEDREGAPLDEWDLAVVERGLAGTRSLLRHEERLLSASRRLRDRKTRTRWLLNATGAAAAAAIIGVAVWALAEKSEAERQRVFTELSRSTDQVLNLLSVEPVEGLMLAIAAVGHSYDALRGEVRAPLQFSLNRAINETWETNLVKHGAPVNAVAIHPYGHVFASGGDKGMLKLWPMPDAPHRFAENIELHEPLVQVQAHEKRINALAFSHDGLRLVTGSDDKSARLWSVNGKPLGISPLAHDGPVQAVAFSPSSGALVTASTDGNIRFWSAAGKLIRSIAGHGGVAVGGLAFSPDGMRLVSGASDGSLQIWDAESMSPMGERIRAHLGAVNTVAFSPDGLLFASGGSDENIHIWDLDGRLIGVVREHEAQVNSLVFRGDGEAIVSGSSDNVVLLAEVEKNLQHFGHLLAPAFKGIDAAVRSVAISPDDQRIVVGSSDETVRTGDWLSSQITLPRHVAFSPRVASLADDGLTFVAAGWSRTHSRRRNLQVEQWQGIAGRGRVISLGSFAPAAQPELALSENARVLLLASDAEGVITWNLDAAQLQAVHAAVDGPISAFAVNRDGSLVAVALASSITLIASSDGRSRAEIPLAAGTLQDLAFSDDGRVLVGATNSCLLAWKLVDAERPESDVKKAQPFESASPDLAVTAIMEPGENGNDSCVPNTHWITSVGVDAKGAYAGAGGRDGSVWVWSLSARAPNRYSFKAHNGQINDLAFRPRNGGAILTSGDDGSVRLWSIGGLALAQFAGHQGRVLDVDFSSNGYTAASAGKDGTVRIWAAHWKQWITLGCRRLENHVRYRRPDLSDDQEARTRAENARRACQQFETKKGSG